MKIRLRWGIRRRRTQRPHLEIRPNHYTTTLLRWGLRRQRTHSHRPRKSPTRIASEALTSSGAPPQLVVPQRHLSASASTTVQPLQDRVTSPTAPPQLVVQQHNLPASASTTAQPLQVVANPTINPFGGRRSLTVFGYEDWNLQRTREFMRKQNVGIVIRKESELNIMLKAKLRNLESNASYKGKGKGKENQAPALPVGSNVNVLSKAVLAQRKRRERENGELQPRQLAQRLRREREKQGNELQSNHLEPSLPRFFPGLIPRQRQRVLYDRECTKLRNQLYQHPSLLQPGPSTLHPQLSSSPDSQSSVEAYVSQPTSQTLANNCIFPISSALNDNITIPPSHLQGGIDSAPITPSLQRNMGDSSTNYFILDDASDNDDPLTTHVDPRAHVNSVRNTLGMMDKTCPHCSALHWIAERLSISSDERPLFGSCCLQGKIRLPLLITPPPQIKALYDGNDDQSKSFRSYTRLYNAANAFTSLGVQMDERVLRGRGPTSFTIHGELRHRTGVLEPQHGQDPIYAQLYIHDPNRALDCRNRRNPQLRNDVLKTIQDSLLRYNAFSYKFRQAASILEREHLNHLDNHDIPAYLHYTAAKDRRTHNLPTSDEVAVILPGDGTVMSGMRDIIVRLRGSNQLMQINECHPAYLPLHYVLMFPHGELGWEPDFKQWDTVLDKASTTRLTQMQFYGYRLFERTTEYSTILRGGKLFQEFIVDAWAATEQNRLTYYRLNQQQLRSELYQGLSDVAADGLNPHQVGKRVVLPSSFAGSPRQMFEIFQDSMAITRYNQHPDIFLTMTANPNWPEIKSALLPHQTPTDRPDLVARVFELKRLALMREIDKNKVFGRKVGHVFTTEFQKRGLPHMHLLIFLHGDDKIRTCEQVNRAVSAEFPDAIADPELYETVISCMIHGPCGVRNPNAPCMENSKCTKRYPKEWADETTMDRDGYPSYQRRNDGRKHILKSGCEVDNRDVVPYNPHLSRMFNCHINVEVCAGLRCVKYIHKYIYKGHDRTTMVLGAIDEIKQYLDARYIGPPEAAWRIFGHPLHQEIPSVKRLVVHLEGQHNVLYNPNESINAIVDRAEGQRTTLTGFFACCSTNREAQKLTYQEFPKYFVWQKGQKLWTPRTRGFAIGRMYFASPNEGERFYLRLLLTVVKGPRSFQCLRTVNNVLHPTYKAACVAKGLLEDDEEWIQCLREAAIMRTGSQLRRLFCVILTQCSPLNPDALWSQFSMHICDDLLHTIRTSYAIEVPTDAQVQDYGLYLLNQLLQESGKSLSDFPPMPLPSGNWSTVIGNRLIWEHRQLQSEAEQLNVEIHVGRLNEGQRIAYNAVISSVYENKGTTFFLSGGAGTGKTFLYNTIATKCRSQGDIVISVASSGIASGLLHGGRTAHSTFCIPLDVLENSFCGFTKQSSHAELFRKARLIIWDEVPMQHRHCVEAVNRTLQDIRDNATPFGGITVILGGDFRQILPVIPRGVREQIVAASLRRSVLWKDIHVLTLQVNMRLNDEQCGNNNFSAFLNEIGANPQETIVLPASIRKCQNVDDMISFIYPQLDVPSMVTPEFLNERTILSARNDDVSAINQSALEIFPGETFTYYGADKMVEDEEVDRTITHRYPNEFLNTLNPPGLPSFKLDLKVGSPIMLLRNIAPKDGLCNGTRLIVVKCGDFVLEAQILTGDKHGNMAFIPRISLTPSSSELPLKITRRQFPVRLAYAMTMNKSQGQSVKFVGVDLRTPVFSHGQLYVALSRCTSSTRMCVLLPADSHNSTSNIVYPEVLL